jgi:hypothetical protein
MSDMLLFSITCESYARKFGREGQMMLSCQMRVLIRSAATYQAATSTRVVDSNAHALSSFQIATTIEERKDTDSTMDTNISSPRNPPIIQDT